MRTAARIVGMATVAAAAKPAKVYVVTGATDGIGRLTAQKLGADGLHVAVHGRTQSKVDAVVAEVEGVRQPGMDLAGVLRGRELLELDVPVREQPEGERIPIPVGHLHLDLRLEHGAYWPPADRELQLDTAFDDTHGHLLDGRADGACV